MTASPLPQVPLLPRQGRVLSPSLSAASAWWSTGRAASLQTVVPTPDVAARSASAVVTAAVGASAMVRSWGSVVYDFRGGQSRDWR